MKQLIITTDISTIRPVFSQGSSENIKRFSQLKKLFEDGKEYQVFAEPTPAGGQKIAWNTEFEGELIPFSKLSEQEKEIAKGRLKFQVNKMYKSAVRFNKQTSGGDNSLLELFELLDSCIEIPDYNDIYFVKNNLQHNFVLIRWGFTSDDFNAQSGLVKKLIPVKVTEIKLKAVLSTGKPAKNEKIIFTFPDEKFQAETDADGNIAFEDVSFLTRFSACQIDKNGEKINLHEYVCDERDEYIYRIGVATFPMNFRATDKSGNPLQNEKLNFEYLGTSVSLFTDANGNVLLPEIPVGTDVSCYQEQGVKQKFVCAQDVKLYEYVGEQPRVVMNFLLVDQAGVPIANSTLRIQVGAQSFDLPVNANGNVILPNIEVGTKVSCAQLVDGEPINQTDYFCQKGKEIYEIKGVRPVVEGVFDLKAIDKSGKIVPNVELQFEFNNSSRVEKTNALGKILLEKIAFNTSVVCKQFINGELVARDTFLYEKTKQEFTFNVFVAELIEIPRFSNLQIQVVDGKKNPVPNLRVAFDHEYITTNRYTDPKGFATVNGFPLNAKVHISAEHKGVKYHAEVNCKEESEFHLVVLKKRNYAIIFWLLLLLLLLAAIAYFLRPYVVGWLNKPIVVDTVKTDTIKKVIIKEGITLTLLDKDSNKPIAKAKVKLDYNGATVDKVTDVDGKVFFEQNQLVNLDINAVVKASGYSELKTTFPFTKEKTIYISSKQSEEVSEIPIPCGTETKSGGFGTTVKVVKMAKAKGFLRMYYNMFDLPDEMMIYSCKPSDLNDSKLIWKTNGPVRMNNTISVPFNSTDSLITIKVIGLDKKTEWLFKVFCN